MTNKAEYGYLENILLPTARRALVTVLEDEPLIHPHELALQSEKALAEDWNRPEEDAAWSHLQPHMHVLRAENVAKIWLATLEVTYNHGYDSSELSRAIRLTGENRGRLTEAWYEYFGR